MNIPVHTVLVLFVAMLLAVIRLADATTAPTQACAGWIHRYYQRIGKRPSYEALERYFTNGLTYALTVNHIEGYGSGQDSGDFIRHRTFNPSWVFRHPLSLDLILHSFPRPDSQDTTSALATAHDFAALEAFVDTWRDQFLLAGGVESLSWKSGGRNLFLRRLVIEMACRHHAAEISDPSVVVDLDRVAGSAMSWLSGYGQIERLFASEGEGAFRRAFVTEARRQRKLRVPFTQYPGRQAVVEARGQLAAMGASTCGWNPAPMVTADLRSRERAEFVSAAATQLHNHQTSTTPLTEILTETTDSGTENDFHFLAIQAERIHDLFDGLGNFIEAVNRELTEPLALPSDVASWEQEMLIQIGLATVRGQGIEALFLPVNQLSVLWPRARTTVTDLRTKIIKRLQRK